MLIVNSAARKHLTGLVLALGAGAVLPLSALADEPSTQLAGVSVDLTQLSLDDLLNIQVTSVSKRPESLSKAAAAIYVVSGDEMRRAGVRSIAEALRLVPGLSVARSNANSYQISSRGFADKLQVLVDGRSAYTPLTSTVFWDVLDTFLPDIDRIEVIRGPGATLWGANAVTGVINIITKSAADTHGTELLAGAGTEERAYAAARTGTAVGAAGHLRYYAKGFERDNAIKTNGDPALDGQRHLQAGLRSDWTPAANQELSVSGDLYSGREHGASATTGGPVETQLSGGNLNSHWTLHTGERSAVAVAFSYDRYKRDIPSVFQEARDTYDLSLQHNLPLGLRQDLTYGLSYRNTRDVTLGPPTVLIFEDPPSRVLQNYSAFVQDQVRFADDAVVWTLGSKFEQNAFTGFDWQPGTRVGWQVNDDWFTWAGASRALRTPNRLNENLAFFCASPFDTQVGCTLNSTQVLGNSSLQAEKELAYEWGLRYSSGNTWSADLATFYNDYRDLISLERTGPGPLDVRYENQIEGRSAGAEVSFNWKPAMQLDLRASYSFLDLDITPKPASTDVNTPGTIEGSAPRHQARVRAGWRFSQDWEQQAMLRYVGRLRQTATPSATTGPTSVPDYAELDLRTAWRPWRTFELALYGTNLLHARHAEFGAANTRSELQRAAMLQMNWSWQ